MAKIKDVIVIDGSRVLWTNSASNFGLSYYVLTLAKHKDGCKGCAFNRRQQCGVDCGRGNHWRKIQNGDTAVGVDKKEFRIEICLHHEKGQFIKLHEIVNKGVQNEPQ